jgi:hypothetical protein
VPVFLQVVPLMHLLIVPASTVELRKLVPTSSKMRYSLELVQPLAINAQYLSSGQGAESLANGMRDRFGVPARPKPKAPSSNRTLTAGMQTCVVRISRPRFNFP